MNQYNLAYVILRYYRSTYAVPKNDIASTAITFPNPKVSNYLSDWSRILMTSLREFSFFEFLILKNNIIAFTPTPSDANFDGEL